MKKLLVLLMALIMVFECSACSGNKAIGSNEEPVSDKTFLSVPVAVGGTISFGKYEQDGDTNNGPEHIEWMVLDVRDGKALLLSRYALDAKVYSEWIPPWLNTEPADVLWETCALRDWLNGDFLNAAFSTGEQAAILTTEVDNSDAQGYDWTTSPLSQYSKKTPGGSNTQDKVFPLSYAEANRYLGVTYEDDNNFKSRVVPTQYAINVGATKSSTENSADGKATGIWWLRSPGNSQDYAAVVFYDGSIRCLKCNSLVSVRPALWVDLESGIF